MPSNEMDARLWLARLELQLQYRRARIDLREEYYAGKHRLGFATPKFLEAFGKLLRPLSDNWCELVVDAKVERLFVEGLRFRGGETADPDARDIWQANGLDLGQTIAHRTAAICEESNILVQPPNRALSGHDLPIITIEHPSQTIVECEPANRRMRRAGLKIWEDNGQTFANVYLPDKIWSFQSSKKLKAPHGDIQIWTPERARHPIAGGWDLSEVQWQANPLGVVPMIPMINKPDAFGCGRSDLEQVIPIQDAINKLFADLMVNSEYVAFPQRYATGVSPAEEDDDPAAKAAWDQFVAGVARTWTSDNEEAKFGQLSGGDISWFVKAIEMAVQHVAAQTRTPPHYLLGNSGNFPSGESLKSTETGLVAKCRGSQMEAGETWEEGMRLAILLKDPSDIRGFDLGAETVWRDAESRSDAERADALSKYRLMGVPEQFIWEKSGLFSQKEIAEMRKMRDDELRLQALGGFDPNPNAQNAA